MQLIKISTLFLSIVLSFSSFSQLIEEEFYTTTNVNGADAMIGSGVLKNKNFKNQKTISVFQKKSQKNSILFRSLLEFDLSQVPVNAIVVEARLVLSPKKVSNTNNPVIIEKVSENWDRTTLTWNNQPKVYQSDKLSFPNSTTQSSSIHEFDVKKHIQNIVSFPASNNGIRVRLKNEKGIGSTGLGISYHGANADNSSLRPKLEVSYVMPIELSIVVTHTSSLSDDGEIEVSVSGGSQIYSEFTWYKYDMGQVSLISTGTDMSAINQSNLSNGLYLVEVKDDYNAVGYQYVFVAKEGETTTVQFHDSNVDKDLSKKYNEDALVTYNYQSNKGKRNYKNSKEFIAEDNAKKYLNSASLLKYKVDFDDQLSFTSANLSLTSNSRGHLRQRSSVTNAGYLSRVSSEWNESTVTWNTKPSISITDQLIIDETIPHGLVIRDDEFDLLNYVEYWQQNPNENFGVELSLQNYGANRSSFLSYYSYDGGVPEKRPVFELSFEINNRLTAEFNESTNEGSISVDAPGGNLPYTYLISHAPISSLDVMWQGLNDSLQSIDSTLFIDSLQFFQGKINALTHEFSNLNSGRYYVSVFDNSGSEIYQNSIIVSPEFKLGYETNIKEENNYLSKNDINQLEGKGLLFLNIPENESGGIAFKLKNINKGVFGFNLSNDSIISDTLDVIFGIKVINSTEYKIITNGVLSSDLHSLNDNDEFLLIREKNEFVLYQESNEVSRKPVYENFHGGLKMNLLFQSEVQFLPLFPIWFQQSKPLIEITYPECGELEGDLNVHLTYYPWYFGLSDLEVILTPLNGGGIVPTQVVPGMSYDFEGVEIGIYSLNISWNTTFFGLSVPHNSNEQIAIGHVVEWITSNNTVSTTANLNSLTTTSVSNSGKSYSEYETVDPTINDNWIQFESKLKTYSNYSLQQEPFKYQRMELVPSSSTAPNGNASVSLWNINWVGFPINFITGTNIGFGITSPQELDQSYRIHQNSGGVQLYEVNSSLPFYSNSNMNQISNYVRAFQYHKPYYNKTITSFCAELELQHNYYVAKTQKQVYGDYYEVVNNEFYFQYNGEYNSSGLIYTLLDPLGEEVSASLYSLGEMLNVIESNKKNADNRYKMVFDSSLSGKFYILKVTNIKGEEEFIRIKI